MAQLKRDVQALRGRLEQAGEADDLKVHVDEGQVQVLLQVGPRWDHNCSSHASSPLMIEWQCLAVTIFHLLHQSVWSHCILPLGCDCGQHCRVEGVTTSLVLPPAPPLLLIVSACRLAPASFRRSPLHYSPCCHLRPPSALCLQVGSCTKDCIVLYLSADDYPNSQMMGMCNNDDELNSKLEGLSEQFEYGASIGEVLQQVCLPACL